MSARTKIAKSLQVGAYAPVVFQPGATGEHIKRAVTELGLTGVTICGETVTAETPPDYKELAILLATSLRTLLNESNPFGTYRDADQAEQYPAEYAEACDWLNSAKEQARNALDEARKAGVL